MRKPARKSFMRNNSIHLIPEHFSSSKYKKKSVQVFRNISIDISKSDKLPDNGNLTLDLFQERFPTREWPFTRRNVRRWKKKKRRKDVIPSSRVDQQELLFTLSFIAFRTNAHRLSQPDIKTPFVRYVYQLSLISLVADEANKDVGKITC